MMGGLFWYLDKHLGVYVCLIIHVDVDDQLYAQSSLRTPLKLPPVRLMLVNRPVDVSLLLQRPVREFFTCDRPVTAPLR